MLKVFTVLNKDDILQHFCPNKSILEKKKKAALSSQLEIAFCGWLLPPILTLFSFFNGKTSQIFSSLFSGHVFSSLHMSSYIEEARKNPRVTYPSFG